MKIQLEKEEATKFFGNGTRIAELLDISQSAVSQWETFVPESSAWKLVAISKTHKYRRKGKLPYFIIKVKL